jgi:hypothetical protein
MNQPTPFPSQEGSKHSTALSQFPSWEGLGVGSWSQCIRKNERGLSMNRLFGVPASAGPDRLKAGLQTNNVSTHRFTVPMHVE